MTSKIVGLTDVGVLKSKEKHGDNSLTKEKHKSIFKRFLENLNDPIIKVLIIALVIEVVFTFGKCDFFEIFGIITAILIATTVSTFSEYGSEKAFLKMQKDSMESCVKVMRNGKIIEILSNELVVGDVVYLFSGETIHADGEILSGKIKVDQSALNGESKEVTKTSDKRSQGWELSNRGRVFRGSVIVNGEAVMRVERVGKETYYGMVAKDVQTETRESPLKLRLGKFASQISKIGYVMAFIVAITYLFNTFVSDNGFIPFKIIASLKDVKFLFSSLIHALTLMITVIVVAAPEGLPMMITVVLSANMKKMLRDGVIVKKLVGIETAGSMNILFTDKTGTLTTGRLQCDKIITNYGEYKSVKVLEKKKELYEILRLNSFYNTESIISDKTIVGGNGTDRALLEFFINEDCPRTVVSSKTPFSSDNKYSSVTLENGLTLIKGAPEIVISKCVSAISENGSFTSFDKAKMEKVYRNEGSEGRRVVAIGFRKKGEKDFVFAALAVLKDKVRKGVKESVLGVREAGVQVVMLTGDGKETAAAIAEECGILSRRLGEIVLTSNELAAMNDGEVKKILRDIRVVARALPQDKVRLVRLAQELELVVGMTGDGINDAPSLKIADVGFAMGNGTDIAKAAGDIILVDNSFFSINRTILYGRTIFKSIRKFITFQLTMNFVACGVSLAGQFLGIDSPITIIQMLWVNIIMDTLGGLAFAGEAPLEYYMREKPKKRDEAILSKEMLRQIICNGLYTLSVCIAFLTSRRIGSLFRQSGDNIYLMTAFYALFIFFGIFNSFGARCERMWIFSNMGKNKPFVAIMIFISAVQLIMIYFGGMVFRTVPLLFKEISYVILIASSAVPFEFIRRIFSKLNSRA